MINLISLLGLALTVNIINMPFDRGFKSINSELASKNIISQCNCLNIEKIISIECKNNFLANTFTVGYDTIKDILIQNKFPFLIGGDHSVAISSIFAVNNYCKKNNLKLGILWFDAHADFNTIQTSITKNLHGMPVAVLCGHTLESLMLDKPLNPEQFAYYGLRDIDGLEFIRMQEYDMKILDTQTDVKKWMKKFDKIHISFDFDCIDPEDMPSVNTPVPNGPELLDIKGIFREIKKSGKLISLDFVEYNPQSEGDNKIINNLINSIFNYY